MFLYWRFEGKKAGRIWWITQDLRRYVELEIFVFVPSTGEKLANVTYFIRFT